MRKFILLIAILLAIFSAFNNSQNRGVINYSVDGKNLRLLVADEPEEWTKGLMNVRKLENVNGMLFIFPEKRKLTFWNKNTLVDLDIYWLDDERVVGKNFLPSIEKSKIIVTVTSPKPVNKVIELIR